MKIVPEAKERKEERGSLTLLRVESRLAMEARGVGTSDTSRSTSDIRLVFILKIQEERIMDEDRFPSQELSSMATRSVSSNSAYKHTPSRVNGSVQSDSPVTLKRLSKVRSQVYQEKEAIYTPNSEPIKEEDESVVSKKAVRPILMGSCEKLGIVRRDQKGNKIEKGKKRHKVTFRDEARNEELYELYVVDSYKKYNQLENKGCCCVIF